MTGGTIKDGEELKVEFPTVTKEITVIASGSSIGPLRVHFNSVSASANVIGNDHFIVLDSHDDKITFNVKCKEIYLSAVHTSSDTGFRLFASLTNIPTQSMFALTGSGLTD